MPGLVSGRKPLSRASTLTQRMCCRESHGRQRALPASMFGSADGGNAADPESSSRREAAHHSENIGTFSDSRPPHAEAHSFSLKYQYAATRCVSAVCICSTGAGVRVLSTLITGDYLVSLSLVSIPHVCVAARPPIVHPFIVLHIE